MSDPRYRALPKDHLARRDVPTLIYDSHAWVAAEHYDTVSNEIASLRQQLAVECEAKHIARQALRDVYSLLEGFRCLNVLDAPVADLDGARERVRAVLEEVETA